MSKLHSRFAALALAFALCAQMLAGATIAYAEQTDVILNIPSGASVTGAAPEPLYLHGLPRAGREVNPDDITPPAAFGERGQTFGRDPIRSDATGAFPAQPEVGRSPHSPTGALPPTSPQQH